MKVRDAMSKVGVTVGPGHTLAEAAALMIDARTGAAVVYDPELSGPGIYTERDLLRAVAAGADPASARVADHMTATIRAVDGSADLDEAGALMVEHGIRHLLVFRGDGEVEGIVSIRDVVRLWVENDSGPRSG